MMRLMSDWLRLPEIAALVDAFPPGQLRFVGGCVRDSLLARPVKDIDAATPLAPDAVTALLETHGIRAVPTGIAHGTITAVIGKRSVEITTLRRDVETFGRHATVAYTDDWREDASRRDFTMNALYLSPAGELFDYFGGIEDARAGRVAFIGDPARRIGEDYLRILRFFRFHAWYGRSTADANALAACAAAAPQIERLSGERIQAEMLKLLSAPRASDSMALMKGEILRYAFGFPVHGLAALQALESTESHAGLAPHPLVRLAALLPSLAALAHVAVKWRLSNAQQRQLRIWMEAVPGVKAGMSVAEQKHLRYALGRDDAVCAVLVAAAAAGQVIDTDSPYRVILRRVSDWQPPEFPVTGNDLAALGIQEGKGLGETLRALEEAWEASDYKLTKEELLAKARP